jgi:hypothetical protein
MLYLPPMKLHGLCISWEQAQVNPKNIHVSRNPKVGYLQRAKATLWIVVDWELGLEPFQFSSL